jgi:hypothetical protein
MNNITSIEFASIGDVSEISKEFRMKLEKMLQIYLFRESQNEPDSTGVLHTLTNHFYDLEKMKQDVMVSFWLSEVTLVENSDDQYNDK